MEVLRRGSFVSTPTHRRGTQKHHYHGGLLNFDRDDNQNPTPALTVRSLRPPVPTLYVGREGLPLSPTPPPHLQNIHGW